MKWSMLLSTTVFPRVDGRSNQVLYVIRSVRAQSRVGVGQMEVEWRT